MQIESVNIEILHFIPFTVAVDTSSVEVFYTLQKYKTFYVKKFASFLSSQKLTEIYCDLI